MSSKNVKGGEQPSKKTNGSVPELDLRKRSQEMIDLEDRVQKGLDGAEDAVAALAEINKSRRYYTELGFDRFDDYCRARWGRSADRFYQKIGWLRVWVNELKPALEPTMVGSDVPPPERAGRELVKIPKADRAAVVKEIAKETARRLVGSTRRSSNGPSRSLHGWPRRAIKVKIP